MAVKTKEQGRLRRHRRVRSKITGTADRPRLAVYRSNARIYAQVIDDGSRHTVVSASSLDKDVAGAKRAEQAALVGKLLAERAKKAGVDKVVFDRGGYRYHGRIKALADGAREGGLNL